MGRIGDDWHHRPRGGDARDANGSVSSEGRSARRMSRRHFFNLCHEHPDPRVELVQAVGKGYRTIILGAINGAVGRERIRMGLNGTLFESLSM